MNTAIAKVGAVVLDCPDPLALAQFYSALTGQPIESGGTDDWRSLSPMVGPAIAFQRAGTYKAPDWPHDGSQQLHLDLIVDEFAESHTRVIALGATPLDPTGPPHPTDTRTFRVYADPVGHPFCLCMC